MYNFKVGPDRPKKRFSGPNSAGLFRTRLKQPRSVPRCGARYEEAKKTGGPFFRWVLSSTPRGLSTLGYSGVPKTYQRVGKASTTSWRASQPNPGHPLVACNRLKFKGGAPDRFWGGLSTPGVLESTQKCPNLRNGAHDYSESEPEPSAAESSMKRHRRRLGEGAASSSSDSDSDSDSDSEGWFVVVNRRAMSASSSASDSSS